MEVKSISLMEYNGLTKHINSQECQKNLYNMGRVPTEDDKRFMEIFAQRNKTQEKSNKISGVFISTFCTALTLPMPKGRGFLVAAASVRLTSSFLIGRTPS